jgi:DNA-directed RNA polymerase
VENYQALAAAHDLYHSVTTPGWKSHAPVKLDGSNNGVQHLSALALDRATALSVNMCADTPRQDVYAIVAAALKVKVEAIASDPTSEEEDRAWAQAWLDFGITRTITKKSVMTLPYGATFFGQADQLMVGIKDQAAKQGKALTEVLRGNANKAAMWLRSHLWAEMMAALPAGVATMEWIQGAARAAAKENLPLTWETPDGFLVVQDRKVVEGRRILLGTAKVRMRITLGEKTDQVDGRKQASSAAPNFIHSLDATALRVYVRTMEANGVHHHALIHDSFGTHAADVETMNVAIRGSFAAVYATRPITALEDYLEANGIEYPKYQEIGTYDLSELIDAPYFFA